ncbi:MAG: hypothetical protein QOF73_2675, partial [Thermomicrobiales bacterium]|nr:hypothetical protein [Thermomicrobiales bacterium]
MNGIGGPLARRIGLKLRGLGLLAAVIALLGATSFGIFGVKGSAALYATPPPGTAQN